MAGKAEALDHLNDIRIEVCSRCAGHPVRETWNGLPDTPCGNELPMVQMIEALHQYPQALAAVGDCPAPSGQADPATLHCPCAMEKVATLALNAARDLEKQRLGRSHTLEAWDEAPEIDED